MKFPAIPLAVLLALASTAAHAVVIKPTSAAASSRFDASYDPVFTINGSGLPSPTNVAAPHANYTPNNHWTTASGTTPTAQWIDWSFAAPQSIGAAYIWNHRSNNIASNSGYEPILFDLTFFGPANTLLGVLNNVSLAPDTAFAQRIDFPLFTGVSRIRFDVEAVQSSPNFTGLAEVAFDTESFVQAPIPEPGTWAVMILGFGACGAALRARRRTANA